MRMINRAKKSDINQKSIKSKFVRFVLVIFTLILGVIVVSNIQSSISYNTYKRTFNTFYDLEQFYTECELMNVYMKNYIYSTDSDEFALYKTHSDTSHIIINRLKSGYNNKYSFRFSLLENTVITYNELVDVIISSENNSHKQSEYDSADRINELIQNTSQEYTKLVTSQMKLDQDMLLESGRLNFITSIVIFICLFIILVVFSISSVKGITLPLEVMIKNINLIKSGKFNIESIYSKNREIHILLSAFREMTINLDNYIKQIKQQSKIEKQLIKQENENLKITKLLSETKLRVLQGQMNPHFLFNTLSMTSKLAYIEGAHKTSELMICTASLLRYSMEMCGQTSNLALEINCLNNYFDIQRKRAGDRISFFIQQTEDFKDISMPGMILQPIIENCVVHGLENKISDGFVNVEIWRNCDRVIITVEDNGKGIDEDMLNRLNETGYINSEKGGLGLANIKERLKLFYSSDFLFVVDSNTECGTVIMLDIPVSNV